MDSTVDAVFPTVRTALMECCDLDEAEVTLERRLVDDLGMESLDFIELVFELEQAFDITIPMGDLEGEIEAAMDGDAYEIDGVLTKAGLQQLREQIPGLHEASIGDSVHVDDVPLLLTVQSVCALLVADMKRRSHPRS